MTVIGAPDACFKF